MTPTQRLVTLRQKQLARSALFLKTAPFLHDDLQFVVHYLPQSTVLIWKNYFNEIRHIENTLIKNRCFIVKMCLIESGHLGPKCDEPWAAETAIVWSQPTYSFNFLPIMASHGLNVFYSFNFFKRKLSLTRKMFNWNLVPWSKRSNRQFNNCCTEIGRLRIPSRIVSCCIWLLYRELMSDFTNKISNLLL